MSPFGKQRGVSIMEALVALVVMAIGAVSVVGMQATLRMNGDVAKQRAEAVRLAQEVIEQWRGFTTLTTTANVVDWTDLVSTTSAATIVGTNTTFSRSVAVVASSDADDNPRSKTVHVTVNWTDRANQPQSITLNSIVAGIVPELGGTLSIPAGASLLTNPGARNPAIPRQATDMLDGTSRFSPPGASGSIWVFNNTTGLIVQVCSDASNCTSLTAMLLTGFVRFQTGTHQPTPAQAEAPTSAAMGGIYVEVAQTVPTTSTVSCFQEPASRWVTYFCAIPVDNAGLIWSGQSLVRGLSIASGINDDNDNKFKVCRYTTFRSNSLTVPADMKNEDHPFNYSSVSSALTNQNFLVIRAGDDDDAFVCPNDDGASDNVSGATWFHQPSS